MRRRTNHTYQFDVYNQQMRLGEVLFDPANDIGSRSGSCLRQRVIPESAVGYTPSLVVLNQKVFPDYLFTDISLVDPRPCAGKKLVTEIEYHKDGFEGVEPKILYDLDEEEEPHTGYCQVITKSSFYMNLGFSLANAVLFGISEYSHVQFIGSMQTGVDSGVDTVGFEKISFCVFIITFWIVRLYVGLRLARKDLAKDAKTGPDIIRTTELGEGRLRCYQYNVITLVMVFFYIVNVPSIVKDLPVHCHPWKGSAPYGAFKMDGARGYLLGFGSECLFRLENHPGQDMLLPIQLLMTVVLTAVKILIIVNDDDPRMKITSLICNILPSLLIAYWNVLELRQYLRDKAEVWDWCQQRMADPSPVQQKFAKNILETHFTREVRRLAKETGLQSWEVSAGHLYNNTDSKEKVLAEQRQKANQDHSYRRKKECAELVRQLQLWFLRHHDDFSKEILERVQDDLKNCVRPPFQPQMAVEVVDWTMWKMREILEQGQTDLPNRRGPRSGGRFRIASQDWPWKQDEPAFLSRFGFRAAELSVQMSEQPRRSGLALPPSSIKRACGRPALAMCWRPQSDHLSRSTAREKLKVVSLCGEEGALVRCELARELWSSYTEEYRMLGCHSYADVEKMLPRSNDGNLREEVLVAIVEQKLMGTVTVQDRPPACFKSVMASIPTAHTGFLSHLLATSCCPYKHGVKTVLVKAAIVRVRELGVRELRVIARRVANCQEDEGPTCPHGHMLQMSERNTGWACGLRSAFGDCKGGITGFHQTGTMRRYHCDECDYDICLACYNSRAKQAESDFLASFGFSVVPVDNEQLGGEDLLMRWTNEDRLTRIRVEPLLRHLPVLGKQVFERLMNDSRHRATLRSSGLHEEHLALEWACKASVIYVALSPGPHEPIAFVNCWHAALRRPPSPSPACGKLAGIVAIHPEPPALSYPTDARDVGPWIRWLHVSPEYHGMGVDRMLLRVVIDWAESHFVPELWTLADEGEYLELAEVPEFMDHECEDT